MVALCFNFTNKNIHIFYHHCVTNIDNNYLTQRPLELPRHNALSVHRQKNSQWAPVKTQQKNNYKHNALLQMHKWGRYGNIWVLVLAPSTQNSSLMIYVQNICEAVTSIYASSVWISFSISSFWMIVVGRGCLLILARHGMAKSMAPDRIIMTPFTRKVKS